MDADLAQRGKATHEEMRKGGHSGFFTFALCEHIRRPSAVYILSLNKFTKPYPCTLRAACDAPNTHVAFF